LAINSSSTTGCQSISTTAKALVSVTAAYNTAQTTDLALYDEGATPTCAAADQLYDPTFGGAQVVNWTELGLTLSNGLAYKATTASILGNIWVQYR
jgi:hypothetical protein